MKRLIVFLAALSLLAACKESESTSDFTGNELTYALQQSSEYAVSGTATFKERRDGTTTAVVSLIGTDGDERLPVHVHLGDISQTDADVVLLLNPVTGKAGTSETVITHLADDASISYKELIKLPACIKIHLSDTGVGRDVILAAGNIGTATTSANGRYSIGVCKSL